MRVILALILFMLLHVLHLMRVEILFHDMFQRTPYGLEEGGEFKFRYQTIRFHDDGILDSMMMIIMRYMFLALDAAKYYSPYI